MSPEEAVIAQVVGLLGALNVPYMLTGSVATSYHGRPRATHDADIVIDPSPPQLEQLLLDLESAGFYVDPAGARDAQRRRGQFNAIEMVHACKIDFIFRQERAFSIEEFSRRQRADFSFGRSICLVTPEDAVLSKLEWARRSGDSARQIADAAGVVQVNPDLDRAYIGRWAQELGVADLWRKIDSALSHS